MRPILMSIAVAVLVATAGPARADDDKDESGRARGGGRGNNDQKEYYKKLEERQREARKRFEEQQREGRNRFEEQRREDGKRNEERYREGDKDQKEYFKRLEEQQREDRKRYEEQYREDDKRAREAGRQYRGDYPAQGYREVYPTQGYRGGDNGYRNSGPRGYPPTAPYPARIARQPGGYDDYPAQPAYPYENGRGAAPAFQPFGDVGDYLGYGQDGYGGDASPGPGVPYGRGRVAPYREEVPLQPDGYDDSSNPPRGPYRSNYYPPGLAAPDSDGVPLAAPLEGEDYLPPEDPDAFEDPFAPQTGGQISDLADQLAGQAETYLQEFLPKLGVVPESQRFLADGTVLRDAAIRFREAALRGAPPADLAAEFQNVAASWQRLEARMVRVSKGRIGPNIARNLQMGETIGQIQQLMPH